MVICLEQGAVLHMAQLMPLPLTVCCFSKIQIGFTFLVPAHPGSPAQRVVKRVCVCGLCYAIVSTVQSYRALCVAIFAMILFVYILCSFLQYIWQLFSYSVTTIHRGCKDTVHSS